MFSLAVKSHWRMALRAVKKAIEVTLQEINQVRKARKYQNGKTLGVRAGNQRTTDCITIKLK